jgi:flagellar biogenesis protein FliO
MSSDVTHVELEEIEITSTEKVLALVLTLFFLIGGIWVYAKLDDIGESPYRSPSTYFTPAEQAAVNRADRAQARLSQAETEVERTRQELELAREEYRTALDANRTAPGLEATYRGAQRDLNAARRRERAARAEVVAAQPEAAAAHRRASEEALDATRQSDLVTFALRLAFLLATLGFAYWLLIRLRRSGSRYLPVAFALVGAGAVLALVLAGDYLTDYIDVQELGPLVLSAAGVALTLFAFWWLQRYLAQRLPQRRVRRGECPFCGYPMRDGEHCEGCGRTVVAECKVCQSPRRVGTLHCGACGAA